MKKIIPIIFISISTIIFGQVGIGTETVDPSAILEVSNSTQKAVLFPSVTLGNERTDSQFPIQDPIEGMVVFNQGGPQINGYYYWDGTAWNLVADNYNNITDLTILGMGVNETLFSSIPNNQYVDYTSTLTEFSNNIKTASYNPTSHVISLPEGIYSIQIDVEFSIPNITADIGGNSGINLFLMKAQFFDLSGTPIVTEQIANSTLNKFEEKNGTVIFDFPLVFTEPSAFKIKFAPTSGSTYSMGVGGSAPNNGSILVRNYKIHIQKSLLLL